MANEERRIRGAHMGALMLGCTILLLEATGAAGQETTPGRRSFCFRGAPASECRAFAITEVAGGYWIAPTKPSDPYRSLTDNLAVTGDFGAMVNVANRLAIGAVLGPGWTGAPYLSVKPRVRFWISERTALDASPGVTVLNEGHEAPRLGVDVSIMVRDQFGVTAQALEITEESCVGEVWPPTCVTNRDWRVYLGVRAGSHLGAYGAGLGALGMLVLTLLIVSGPPS